MTIVPIHPSVVECQNGSDFLISRWITFERFRLRSYSPVRYCRRFIWLEDRIPDQRLCFAFVQLGRATLYSKMLLNGVNSCFCIMGVLQQWEFEISIFYRATADTPKISLMSKKSSLFWPKRETIFKNFHKSWRATILGIQFQNDNICR